MGSFGEAILKQVPMEGEQVRVFFPSVRDAEPFLVTVAERDFSECGTFYWWMVKRFPDGEELIPAGGPDQAGRVSARPLTEMEVVALMAEDE